MDSHNLPGLKKAYEVAPSTELAKIICLSLIDSQKIGEITPYLVNALKCCDPEETLVIADSLSNTDLYSSCLEILGDDTPEQQLLVAKCLQGIGKINEAYKHYQSAIDHLPELERADLNRLFNVNMDVSITDNRIKLKVVEKAEVNSITDLQRYRQETTDFSDVVGLTNIKKQINKKIIMPFQLPSLFQKFKKKVGGGVLLYGPPGCGKTLLARATAGECNAEFYNIEISDVLDMYIGESEQKLHAIFEKARAKTPSVLFFDEIEALAGKREHSRNSSTANIVSQFLTELDGFSQNNEGVLILASTNVPWAVDAAFLRPGRFDRMFFIPPPDKNARTAILEHHTKDRPAEDSINFSVIATKANGYSGADLFNLVEMAADEAIDESIEKETEIPISFKHFKEALKDTRPTTIEWLTTARNYARYANDGGRYDDVLDFLKKNGH